MSLSPDPFDASDVEVAVHNVETTVELLGESTREADLDPHEWEDLCLLLKRLRAARRDLQVAEAALERAIDRQWRRARLRDAQPVMGVGTVEVYRGKHRSNWDHPALAAAVLDAHLAGTPGEVPDPWEVRDWLMETAGIGYWRVKALRNLGIDADGYCTAVPGVPSVKITG